jgi:hypothetical protein
MFELFVRASGGLIREAFSSKEAMLGRLRVLEEQYPHADYTYRGPTFRGGCSAPLDAGFWAEANRRTEERNASGGR